LVVEMLYAIEGCRSMLSPMIATAVAEPQKYASERYTTCQESNDHYCHNRVGEGCWNAVCHSRARKVSCNDVCCTFDHHSRASEVGQSEVCQNSGASDRHRRSWFAEVCWSMPLVRSLMTTITVEGLECSMPQI